MKRSAVLMLLIVVAAACGTSPVAPTAPLTRATLSGVVSAVTPAGVVALEGAEVWTNLTTSDPLSWSATDDHGRYQFVVFLPATLTVSAGAEGYQTQSRPLTITGNTTLDFELQPN